MYLIANPLAHISGRLDDSPVVEHYNSSGCFYIQLLKLSHIKRGSLCTNLWLPKVSSPLDTLSLNYIACLLSK